MILDAVREFTAAFVLLLLYLSPLAAGVALVVLAARRLKRRRFLAGAAAGAVALAVLYVSLCLAVSAALAAGRRRCRRNMLPAYRVIREECVLRRTRGELPAGWIGEGDAPSCRASGRPEPYLYFAVADVHAPDGRGQPYMACPGPHRGCPLIAFSPFADRRPCREVLCSDSWIRTVPETDWRAQHAAAAGPAPLPMP